MYEEGRIWDQVCCRFADVRRIAHSDVASTVCRLVEVSSQITTLYNNLRAICFHVHAYCAVEGNSRPRPCCIVTVIKTLTALASLATLQYTRKV